MLGRYSATECWFSSSHRTRCKRINLCHKKYTHTYTHQNLFVQSIHKIYSWHVHLRFSLHFIALTWNQLLPFHESCSIFNRILSGPTDTNICQNNNIGTHTWSTHTQTRSRPTINNTKHHTTRPPPKPSCVFYFAWPIQPPPPPNELLVPGAARANFITAHTHAVACVCLGVRLYFWDDVAYLGANATPQVYEQSAKCRSAECKSAKWHSAEKRFAEWHSSLIYIC